MKIIIETGGYVFSKDYGYSPEQFGTVQEEYIPHIEEVISSACYLIGKAYSDRQVKEALTQIAKDY